MRTNTLIAVLASSFLTSYAAPAGDNYYSSCQNVTIPVSSYKIFGVYCSPTKDVAGHRDHLQLLVHGATYTRLYWTGLKEPGSGSNQYSWVQYANNQGYPTLAIDRLCNGGSTHLNGSTSCDFDSQVDAVHGVVTALRSKKVAAVPKTLSKIILVGHSYGSGVSNVLNSRYPADVDATFLTGFSKNFSTTPVTQLNLMPAQQVDPARWGYLNDPSYMTPTNRSGYKTGFYDGAFDLATANFDYDTRHTISTSEFVKYAPPVNAPGFKGPLFVLNGNLDHIFCAKSEADAGAGVPGNCASGFTTDVKSLYPATSKFGFYDLPKAAHCLNLHLVAQQGFKAAHDFMAQVGL